MRGFKEDREFIIEVANAMNETLLGIAKAFGAKIKNKKESKKAPEGNDKQLPSLDTVMSQLGGSGVVFQK